jgi:hypothetical protein
MRTNRLRFQVSIADFMVLVAGFGVGLWILVSNIRSGSFYHTETEWQLADWRSWMLGFYAVLLGLMMAGSCVLLVERFRRRRRWRAGAFSMFLLGMESWLFTPMAALNHYRGSPEPGFFWATFSAVLPITSFFLLVGSIVGGRPVRGWWACRGWWPEWLGMWALVAFSLPGLYFLALIVATYYDLFT